ncbi:MAG: hypothetical protein KJ950_02190 [Proteobacteria bacterium]|nr:hypothetical protein [Pseudomonadota bacterium]MBU1687795.1 hypothetical protein [Pseudomonadota bacterium]
MLILPRSVHAADLTVERAIQRDLTLSQSVVLVIDARQKAGQGVTTQIARLKELAAAIRTNHERLRGQFEARDEVTANIGETAEVRQQEMVEKYLAYLDDYLTTIDRLPDDTVPQFTIDDLKFHFDQILPERTLPLLGALPYRHLRLPGKYPLVEPVVVPGYRGGNRTVAAADTAASPEAPITEEIATLAESLHWSPVEIYAWVKNNIRSEWYWGLMKGAEETLRQKSGNDADQASLLVALLRAAGFPARFVRGEIEFFPNLSGIKALTGIDDTRELVLFFQKAGIPCEPVIRGGGVANIRVDHIWVEAQIPYANYRGVVIDGQGKTWLGLDTHIKMGSTVTTNTPQPFPEAIDPAGLRDAYLATDHDGSVLDYLHETITATGTAYDDLLRQQTFSPEILEILPNTMQFEQIVVTGEYTQLPEELIHQVRFTANHNETTILDGTLPLSTLSNRSLAITYEPATVDDQEIINSYGGLANTPSYLVHLRPVLTVNGDRTLIGTEGLPVGENFTITVELIAPNRTQKVTNNLIIGNLTVMGLSTQQAITPEPETYPTAEGLLFSRAMAQIDEWNKSEQELAELFGLTITHPMPTLVTVSNMVDVIHLLDMVHGLDWRGVAFDADFRVIEAAGNPENVCPFMQLSSLAGSVLEHRVFEEGFNVASVSTARVLGLSNQNSLTPLVLDKSNFESELPGLALPENISEDIASAAWMGLRVIVPPFQSNFEDWLGYGYIKEDPVSGEAGYMLAGMIAGGMTALNPDRWPDEFKEPVSHPFQGEVNRYPDSAVELVVLAPSLSNNGFVGKPMNQQLQVMARDSVGRPVSGVMVYFTVLAGGGALSNDHIHTDSNGIASVSFTPGQHVSDNPTIWYDSPHNRLVGENLIDASTASGLRINTPMTVFAFPDIPKHLKVSNAGPPGEILTWSETIKIKVEDQYGNSVSNVPVTFTMGNAQPWSSCDVANGDNRQGKLVSITDPCLKNNIPVYGECGAEKLDETTWDFGSAAQVILGSIPAADYPITIKAGTLAEEIFTVTSKPFGNCYGNTPPQHDLVLKEISLTDQFGNNINAAGVGTTMKIEAKMFMVTELERFENQSINCNPGSDTCPIPLGTREYRIDTGFETASVSFNGQEVTTHSNGLFKLDAFQVGDTYGKKPVTITGNGTRKVNRTVHACETPPACTFAMVEETLPEISITKEIYAVAIDLPQAEYLIPINQEGYTTADTVINYTIQPAEYTAGNAMVTIGKKNPGGKPDPDPIRYLDAERNGTGFVTLAKGFRFEPDTDYVAWVILNKGSDSVEIKSQVIDLKPIALDLRADLNRDGKITIDDDPLEIFGFGLVVPVNSDDDDGDGVIDLGDDFVQTGDGSEDGDNDLFEVQLTVMPKGVAQGNVTLEVVQGMEKIRIWTNRKKLAGSLVLDGFVDPAMETKSWQLGSADSPSLDQLPEKFYIEGIDASQNLEDCVILTTKYQPDPAQPATAIEVDRLRITVLQSTLVPDYNRDGMIDKDDKGKANDIEPWRFWVNDDNDNAADSDGIATSASNDLPGTYGDLDDQPVPGSVIIDPGGTNAALEHVVGNIRDYVDFFPLHLDVGGLLDILPPDHGYRYILKNAESAVGVAEGISGATVLRADDSYAYLHDPVVAGNLGRLPVRTVNPDGMELTVSFLHAIKQDNQAGIILVEGRKTSNSPLMLEVQDENDQVVFKASFPMSILPVEVMYGHKDLRSLAGATDGEPDRYVDFTDTNSPDYYTNAKTPYCMKGADRNLVWMHGYNVSSEAARATYAEVFKRFFHAGLQGRFYGVSWYGDPPAPLTWTQLGAPPHFHQSVVNAFATAGAYENFIKSIPGSTSIPSTTTIAAHSLGNMVVGSAIQDHDLIDFKKYFAIDAAVALEAYGELKVNDQTVVDEGMLTVDDWKDYWDYSTIDSNTGTSVYPDRKLFASEWYRLFPSDDKRSELTWRNRLDQVPSNKVYNFYSSTEEVLRQYPGDDIAHVKDLWQKYQKTNNTAGIKEYLATSTWVKQEKYKGRKSLFGFDYFGGAASPFCGWSFNRYWYLPDPYNDFEKTIKPNPDEASSIDENELTAHPFFDPPIDPFGVNLTALVSSSGSSFVDNNIGATPLKDYYTYNQATQSIVKIKEWLLAEAFPATTLPMGANENSILPLPVQNTDMSEESSQQDGKCCKTRNDLWPRSDPNVGRPWLHSDYKDVPYQHVFSFYKNIKEFWLFAISSG